MPEGFLAALIVPGASITERFELMLDCVDGAVGLCAQAASSGIMERRGDSFIKAPVKGVDQRPERTAALAVNARGADAHFRGHWRHRSPDIRRGSPDIHRAPPTHTFTPE